MTGCGRAAGRTRSEFALASPHSSRANSITAQCRPRHSPRNGTSLRTRVAGRRDLALDAAHAEPAGHDDAVEAVQPAFGEQAFGVVGRDPVDHHLGAARVAAVLQRLDHREVRVGQVDVLADEPDAHVVRRPRTRLHERAPLGEVGLVLVEVQHPAHVVVEALVVQHERDLVEDLGVDRR